MIFVNIDLVLAAIEYASKAALGKGIVSSYKPASCSYAECVNKHALPKLAKLHICIEAEVQKLLNVADIKSSLKAAGVSFIAYVLTSRFSLFTLAYALIIFAFSIPFVYTTFKTEIDAIVYQYYSCAKYGACKVCEQIKAIIKPHVDCALKKADPLIKNFKALVPGTALSTGSNGTSDEVSTSEKISESTAEPVDTAVNKSADGFSKAEKIIENHTDSVVITSSDSSNDVDEISAAEYTTGSTKLSHDLEASAQFSSLPVVDEIKAVST